jgi:hypothetical protein
MKIVAQQLRIIASVFLLALAGLTVVLGFFVLAAMTGAFYVLESVSQPK